MLVGPVPVRSAFHLSHLRVSTRLSAQLPRFNGNFQVQGLRNSASSFSQPTFLAGPGRRLSVVVPSVPRPMALVSAPGLATQKVSLSGEARSPEEREELARQAWRGADCVCFDVDSTVSTEEGIDVLAKACGKEREVSEWTRKAMGGNVLFQEAIRARLQLMLPPKKAVEHLLETHDFPITPGIPELIRLLHQRKTDIYFISGGLKQLVEPIADRLEVPRDNIFAIELFWNSDGTYSGFDEDAPTASTGGKKRVLQHLKQKYHTIVMVGDGATDLEAIGTATAMVGFGANAVRPLVKEGADWYAYDTETLTKALQ